MEITKEIYAAHQKLSNCSAKFLDFVGDNPDSLKRSNFNALLGDGRFDYFKSQPWPTFINNKTKKEMEEASVKVCGLIKSIPGRLFSYDPHKISSYYGIDHKMAMLLLHGVDDDHLSSLLGRGDFILAPSGQLKCLEFNMQTNMGGWELDLLEPLYLNLPIIARFLKESNVRIRKNRIFSLLLEHVLEAFLEKHAGAFEGRERREKGEIGEVNMAMVFPGSSGLLKHGAVAHLRNLYKQVLIQKKDGLKGDFFIGGNDSLKLSGDSFVYAGHKIHILIEMSNGYVPVMFMEAVRKGNLVLCNGPVTRLMSNKLNLALLSEHRDSDLFSPEERELIKKYVPWTRKLIPGETTFGRGKVKLEDLVHSHRERLVLKSAEGLGGREVFPGYSTSPAEWQQRVENALKQKQWIIQEYIPPSSYYYQRGEYGWAEHHAVWGLFVFGSRYAGGFVRVLAGEKNRGVINTHQGAEESIILEVEEP